MAAMKKKLMLLAFCSFIGISSMSMTGCCFLAGDCNSDPGCPPEGC